MIRLAEISRILAVILCCSSNVFGDFDSRWLKRDDHDVEFVYPRITLASRFKRMARMDEFAENQIRRNDIGSEPVLIVIRGDNKTFFFELYRVDGIISPNFTFYISEDSTQGEDFNSEGNVLSNCLYRGKVISHLPGLASFSNCNGDGTLYGSWITDDGHYVLRPDMDSESSFNGLISRHKLYKLGSRSPQVESDDVFCETPTTHYVDSLREAENNVDRFPEAEHYVDRFPEAENYVDRFREAENNVDRFPEAENNVDRFPEAENYVDRFPKAEYSEQLINPRFRRAAFASKVIETAVFADSALNNKFQKKYKSNGFQKLTSYIMAVVNEVQLIYDFDSMETKFKLVLVRLEVLKPSTAARYSGKTKVKTGSKMSLSKKGTQPSKSKAPSNAPGTGGGDIDKYLDSFCNWQAKKDPPEGKNGHWDHAIMLTGLDLYKSTGKKKNDKVLGQAWLDGMCIPKYSCTINEGDDFEAAYVIAHEMGHNLGMPHDGDGNNCDGNKFIMSPVTGAGKITWSVCSNKALKKFLNKDQVKSCLNDDAAQPPKLDYDKNGVLPGQEYPPDAQCKLAMGKNYAAYIPNKKPYSNICRELWCITGMTATTTHPALDGSSCEPGKVCRQGKCAI